MNITPDYLIERRHYKNQIRLWKLFVVALIFVNIIIFGMDTGKTVIGINQDYIAFVRVTDSILDDSKREEILLDLKDDDKVKAMIVHIDSCGGTAADSERLYNVFKLISSKKPVVAVIGKVAASGGYMIALGANYIIAHNSSITGSIGVIFQSMEITSLAEKMGITFNNFKSSELKASPNPTEKLTPEVQAAVMSTVKDIYDYFVDIVAERRSMSKEEVLRLADGKIFTGRQAYDMRLIDAIGAKEDAERWIKETNHFNKDLAVREVPLKPKRFLIDRVISEFDNKISSMFSSISGMLMISNLK